jgi:hypothetical protein
MQTTIISKFSIPGTVVRINRFGPGLINDTYLCEFRETDSLRKYILQRINPSVFKHPEQVMANVEAVTSHIAGRLRAEGVVDPYTVMPALVHTRRGQLFSRDAAGAYWRMFHFIESGTVFDTVRDGKHAFEIGRCLGRFQALVADMKPAALYTTLPGFHHTPRYLAEYDDALAADVKQRVAEVATERAFISCRRDLAMSLDGLVSSGQLPLRVVHNDPKVNNIMVRTDTHEALCMLDLDTVMPGIIPVDFGDCVRSVVNPAGEDAHELGIVALDFSLFEAVTRGYLQEAGGFLVRKEIETLPVSVKVITFELGLRFLADYLRGDTYFKITYPAHNLHRARVQFKLLESIEAAEDRMAGLVAGFSMTS